ncbi:MAG: hypothetical protein PHD88_04110 [Firmicutes bacterium]|nr:hypothetical protein [Bacillota bacterium]MDD4693574.1 hypothetical protein [Bacillota bacterium]
MTDFNNEDIIKQVRARLEKMPLEQRKKLAEDAMRIIGTNDPEQLKEMLKKRLPNLDPDTLQDTIDQFLKENM